MIRYDQVTFDCRERSFNPTYTLHQRFNSLLGLQIPMLKDFARKIYGNFVVMRHLPGQKRVPYLPQGKWQALRDARVRAIVRHAAATVPHYRDLFRTEGIDPREIRSATDLDRLPLLDKATVWQSPERFLSESYSVKM